MSSGYHVKVLYSWSYD